MVENQRESGYGAEQDVPYMDDPYAEKQAPRSSQENTTFSSFGNRNDDSPYDFRTTNASLGNRFSD